MVAVQSSLLSVFFVNFNKVSDFFAIFGKETFFFLRGRRCLMISSRDNDGSNFKTRLIDSNLASENSSKESVELNLTVTSGKPTSHRASWVLNSTESPDNRTIPPLTLLLKRLSPIFFRVANQIRPQIRSRHVTSSMLVPLEYSAQSPSLS